MRPTNIQETNPVDKAIKRHKDKIAKRERQREELRQETERVIKELQSEYDRWYYQNNKEKKHAQSNKWRHDNRDRYNELQRNWREKNKEKYNEYQKKYMAKIRAAAKITVIVLLLAISSCKTQQHTITRDRIVNDTIITHTTRSVLLPVKNVTILDKPCANDSLKPLNQTISTPFAKVTLRENEGSLVVEVNTDSIVNERVRQELSRYEKDTTVDKQIITKYRLPGWMWYIIGYAVLLTIYTFRRFIPYLNMIP